MTNPPWFNAEFERLFALLKTAKESPKADETWHLKWRATFERIGEDIVGQMADDAREHADAGDSQASERYRRETLFRIEAVILSAVREIVPEKTLADEHPKAPRLN
jgi:hypothetical protein